MSQLPHVFTQSGVVSSVAIYPVTIGLSVGVGAGAAVAAGCVDVGTAVAGGVLSAPQAHKEKSIVKSSAANIILLRFIYIPPFTKCILSMNMDLTKNVGKCSNLCAFLCDSIPPILRTSRAIPAHKLNTREDGRI